MIKNSGAFSAPKMTLFLARERQECDIPAPLHCDRDLALVPCAVAGYAAGEDFAALGNEEAQRLDVFVIDERCLVNAETAHLLPDLETPLVRASAVPAVASAAASGVRRPFR